ncbi:hypothetical protein [Anaerorhabdus sp.]|uniref:hypothetical protein n=1 Tax=Anaerorhabdus sp. TaxID=1872524 RepID=UPI002B21169D|nr:hypothetical protein [Anaerorhabdus sp.]MEA4875399.1 hypothetical protein [Anaerorhabdus sp.]
MAFYFNNKLSVDIENKQYTIDLSTNKVMNSVREIKEKSLQIANKKDIVETDIENYTESMKRFIKEAIGEASYLDIFTNDEFIFEDIAALVQFLLVEIEKFKKEKLEKFNPNKTPKKIN